MKTLRVGLSPCPNDTFIFHALLEGFVELENFHLEPVFEDVETLNVMARNGELEITKISFHAYGHLRNTYKLLQAGAALGRGCGPLIVVREGDEERDLSTAKIAIPGKLTSANLLLRLFAPRVPAGSLIEMTFDRIMDAVTRAASPTVNWDCESWPTWVTGGKRPTVTRSLWAESSPASTLAARP